MSQFIHEASVTLITKYFIRRYNCRPLINPHDHNHFVVSFTKLDPFYFERARNMSSVYFWVWVCLSYLQNLWGTTLWGFQNVRSIGMEIHTIFYASKGPNSQRRRCRNESMAMGSIGHITYHTTQKQAASQSWKWPTNGTTEAPITEQYSTKMGCQFIHYPRDLNMRLCLQQKVYMVQEQRSRSRSGPTYCQRPSGRL